MKITVNFECDALLAQIEGMAARAQDFQPALDEIGSVLLAAARATFDNKSDPLGIPWAPLKNETILNKLENHWPLDILRATLALEESISYTVGSDYVAVGTDVPYGAEHMTGRRYPTRMPARPFLGMPTGGESVITQALIDHLIDA
jgi:phage virion morphogenesis protein